MITVPTSWHDAHTRIRGEHSPTLEGEVHRGIVNLPRFRSPRAKIPPSHGGRPSIYKLVKLPLRFGPLRPEGSLLRAEFRSSGRCGDQPGPIGIGVRPCSSSSLENAG